MFFKDEKLQNSRSKGFSYLFCLMLEGSGTGPLTNGSGRPKNGFSDPYPAPVLRPPCDRVKNNNLADFLLSGLRGFLYKFFTDLNGEEICMLIRRRV